MGNPTRSQEGTASETDGQRSFQPHLVVLYCRNATAPDAEPLEGPRPGRGTQATFVALPCSSKMEPSHPLKILADGADGVLVVACPEERCRHLSGSARADKRVRRVRTLLDAVGAGAERVALEHGEGLSAKDLLSLAERRGEALKPLGPNPMKEGSRR